MLELNLGWNSLRGKGGAALAEGLKGNSVLNKVDIGWNGLGDVGARAVPGVGGLTRCPTCCQTCRPTCSTTCCPTC